jgi:signal transduction histidine kinase
MFGVIVAIWEFSSFMSKTSFSAFEAADLYRITLISSHIGFPLYLATLINIREKRDIKTLLIFLPLILQLGLMSQENYFVNYEFFMNELGLWVYKVTNYNTSLIINSSIFIGYMIWIFIELAQLVRITNLPLLKRKYKILFTSFLIFQIVGTTIINALIALNILNPIYRAGGIFQFLSFISIWYVLSMKNQEYSIKLEKGNFSKIYSSFLTSFYHKIGSHLGEESFRFTNFLKESKIANKVSYIDGGIICKFEKINIISLINRNLNVFTKGHFKKDIIEKYLRVLNAADIQIGLTFKMLVRKNEDFLKEHDLIYGISNGKYIDEIDVDDSLRDLDDPETCLRIYKRILLPVVNILRDKTSLKNKLLQHNLTEGIAVSSYGEISFDSTISRLGKIPDDNKINTILETFNSVLGQVYDELLEKEFYSEIDFMLGKLNQVLRLNKEKAISLGIYPTLLGRLATKIPRTQVHKLYSDYLEELIQERTNELEKTQEKLLKVQRMAAIGEAAAMVGHDLRNPLQAIVNTLYLAKKKAESYPGKDLDNLLQSIGEQVEYMNKIVSDLQDFARPIKPKIKEITIDKIIDSSLETVNIPNNIKVTKSFINYTILSDFDLLKRVFTNIILNAFQAMNDGGELNIRTEMTREKIRVYFQDNGIGIPKENLTKIFQPLFTTKAKGQGLGLAVCKRIVESMNGNIIVESNIGKGSDFIIELPILKNTNLISKKYY